VFEWALSTAPDYAWTCDGDPPAYCFGRHGRLFDQVGPVVSTEDDTACRLVDAALEGAAGHAVTIDAVDAQAAFGAWLRRRGFAVERPLFRMRRPPAQRPATRFAHPVSALAERAILGPEFA
jgi:hypothetical protein